MSYLTQPTQDQSLNGIISITDGSGLTIENGTISGLTNLDIGDNISCKTLSTGNIYGQNGNLNIGNATSNIVINGSNITLTGPTVYVQSQTVQTIDNNIELNYGGTNMTAVGSGITVLGNSIVPVARIQTDTNLDFTITSPNNRLTVNNVVSTIGNITTINNTNLFSTTGNITTINSTTGNITNLTSSTGNITTLTAPTINNTNLNSTTGNITTINNTNFKSSNVQVGDTPFSLQTGTRLYVRNTSTVDNNINGSISGNVYHQFGWGSRNWVFSQDTSNDTNMLLGCQGGGDPDPDFEYYFKRGVGLQIQPSITGLAPDFTTALSVLGSTNISGNLTVNQSLSVTQNTTIAGNLTVNQNVVIDNNLTVNQNANIVGNLNITGNTITNNTSTSNTIIGNTGTISNLTSTKAYTTNQTAYTSSIGHLNVGSIQAKDIRGFNVNATNGNIDTLTANTSILSNVYATTIGSTNGSFNNLSVTQFGSFSLMPPGTIQMTVINTILPPTGWLYCRGQAVDRAVYATLFNAIGTLFGVGDGSTTFNVPDFRGMFLRGYGVNGFTDPNTGIQMYSGPDIGTIQRDSIQNHEHNVVMQNVNDTIGSLSGGGSANAADNSWPSQLTQGVNPLVAPYYARQSAETRPVCYSVNYLIKF